MGALCVYSRTCRKFRKSLLRYYCNESMLQQCSNYCQEINTKVLTPTIENRSKRKQRDSDDLFGNLSNYLSLAASARKIASTWCEWSWFCFSLVKTGAIVCGQSQAEAAEIEYLLSKVIENCSSNCFPKFKFAVDPVIEDSQLISQFQHVQNAGPCFAGGSQCSEKRG